ncbi:MAG: SOS response-associated peptidase [Pseudomonadales bacterium]
MCGRFNVVDDPFLAGLLEMLGVDLQLHTRMNIAPTEPVHMICDLDGRRTALEARWWLLPAWAKEVNTKYSMFNARSENLLSSRAFSRPFKRQRGIVPASSFIEWQKTPNGKQAQGIELEESAIAFAAVFEQTLIADKNVVSCAIITKAASPEFESIHNRMPVMLNAAELEPWLDNSQELSLSFSAFVSESQPALLISPLSSKVNNAVNKKPDDFVPIGPSVRVD